MASEISSDSEFDGFDEEQVLSAVEKDREIQERVRRIVDNESDVDVSEEESEDSAESSDEDEMCGDIYMRNVNRDWDHELSEVNIPAFEEETGVQNRLNPDARPIDYFFRFLPQVFFENLATETNRYATQKGPDPRWSPTNANEMRAFVSINIFMGVRQLPCISNYWSTDERFSDPFIASIMPKTRFVKINQYLHLRDTSNTPGRNDPAYDPLFKVRNLIDVIQPKLRETYKPGKNLSVDEGMIGFKGRLHFRQYMPAKPTKWGIKVWQICESDTGYCCGFDIYTGKKPGGRQHGLGYDVVWNLSKHYHHQNRHLYFDRFFSSVTLAEHLELVGTYVCGTIVANRKGLPDNVKKAKLKNRGDIIQMQKGNLIATSFKDKRQITFLSSFAPPHLDENTGKPHVNILYNKHMGGVDKFDQMASYYPVGRPGTKWWRYILWYIVNLSILNAWVLYQKSEKNPPPQKGYDHLGFRMDVADQLRAGFTSRKHRIGRKAKNCNKKIAIQSINHHELVKIDGRKKMCRECSLHNRKTLSGRPVETTFKCGFCDLPLCRNGCFTSFHERNLN
ncbi:piggyBac transposable element-derived protein 4-like [Ostrea edulis]|uniref:piggyBac transposable element-derived protein 4-like n=1 Tax=Ostrea edulis TaxID=37623 RepID=UPI0024AEB140|nr:piggyBac transposable element-derived protein 4-like [Ostrea edulis]